MKTLKILATTLTAATLITAAGTAVSAPWADSDRDVFMSIDAGAQGADYNGSRHPGSGTGPGRGVGPGPNTGGGGSVSIDRDRFGGQSPSGLSYSERNFNNQRPFTHTDG